MDLATDFLQGNGGAPETVSLALAELASETRKGCRRSRSGPDPRYSRDHEGGRDRSLWAEGGLECILRARDDADDRAPPTPSRGQLIYSPRRPHRPAADPTTPATGTPPSRRPIHVDHGLHRLQRQPQSLRPRQ